MDLKFDSLNVIGYKDQPVPNTFITHSQPTNHLGIILPGYRYPAEMPPLHYASSVLLNQGADVLQVEYAYYRTNFMKQPESEQDQWISADVFAACEAGLSRRSYERITLIGKSLGTIAMGHLLSDVRFQKTSCVWMTPILSAEWLCSRIEQVRTRSLFIIGTADQFYRPDVLSHLEQVTHGRSVVLDGVIHSLEVPGDIPKSLDTLKQIVQAVQEFVNP